jgi:hypothetical protein
MGEGTGEIRQDIEETRGRIGEEVEALSYKTDVGARVGDFVEDKKEAALDTVSSAKDSVASAVGSVTPSRDAMRRSGRKLGSLARSNPLGLAIAGAATGFLAGLAIPSTRVEEEHLGEMADRVKSAAAETGQDALERGKHVAETAIETVKEEARTEGAELASDLKERVQQPQSQTSS